MMFYKIKVFLAMVLFTSIDITTPAFIPRIINGKISPIVNHPYQVGVGIGGLIHCGGVLISKTYILTAAHCIRRDSSADNFVQVKASTRDERDGQRISIKRQLQHPHYNESGSHDLDFGLIELASEIEFDDLAVAIPLVHNDDEYDEGAVVEITGYGLQNTNDSVESYHLQLIEVQLNSWDECKKVVKGMTESMLCAGINSKQDTCNGDSGGPVVLQTRSGVKKLVAIVSFGYSDCGVGVPEYFARVSKALPWIQNVTGDYSL